MNRGAIEESLEDETNRAARAGYQNDVEEVAARERDRTRKWETRQGDGATYRVDVSDYDNLVVQLKLHLIPKPGSKTTADDIARMERIEQGVERAAARVGGYLFDLQFSHVDGPDVFTVGADIGDWPKSGNIVGGADMLVHEVHHRLRLPDRYDYIEVHAENEAMPIPLRLKLFQRQMARGIKDPLAPYSLMDEGGPDRRLTDEDVCLVADPAHAEECIAKRNRVEIELIRLRAWGDAVRTWNALVDVIAGDSPLAAANAQRLAELAEPPGDVAEREAAVLFDVVVEVDAVDVFHHEAGPAGASERTVDQLHDVRMVEPLHGQQFALEALADGGDLGQMVVHHLYDDLLTRFQVASVEDLAHAAFS